MPQSILKALEGLRSAPRMPQFPGFDKTEVDELRPNSDRQGARSSGIEEVEDVERLGIKESRVQDMMACLPGKSLKKMRFAPEVNLKPNPMHAGEKVFSAISREHETEIDLTMFSPDNYGGDERARGFMVDEMTTELLRAYARANKYSANLDAARAVEMFVKDKMPAELVSGQVEKKLDQAWETLICLAAHVPVSEYLEWEQSFKLGLMATHGIGKEDAEKITSAMAKSFKADPNEFVPNFQEKEKNLKRSMRLHELSQTISGAIANTPIVSIYTRGLHDPDALTRFALAVKQKEIIFHIKNERSVLARSAELALNAAYARRAAELDGSSFPEAMGVASAQARSLSNEWGKLLSKRKEIRDVLVGAWHQAMSDYKE